MTTTPATVAVPQQAAQRFDRGRVLRIVFGSLGILAAFAFLAGGVALTWSLETHRDGSGYFVTHTHHYQTSSFALTTESLNVNGASPTWVFADRLARIRIAATSTDAAKPLFVGIARTEDVDRYLARVAHDEIGDLEIDPFSVAYTRLGRGAPGALPATRTFWRVRASGTGTQTISWPVQDGHWSAVVMNADGRRKVSVDARLAARLAGAWWIVTVLLVLAGLSLLGGGAFLYSGVRKRTLETAEVAK